ncbi:MAG: DUF4845 domain-containing protein [Pseudomonadota bacterium]
MDSQRGVSLSGLIFVLALAMVFAMLALKIVPSILEFNAAKDAIASAKKVDGTVQAIRTSFDKNADINTIEAIGGKDLIVTKVGGQTEVAFAYRKEIKLLEKVHLVIDYAATTDPSGVTPEKPETAPK